MTIEASRSSGWRPYVHGWGVVGLILLTDVVWLALTGRSVRQAGIVDIGKALVMMAAIFLLLRGMLAVPRYREVCARFRYAEVSNIVAWYALILCLVSSASVLSYLCVTIDTPLVEASLVRIDQALGFDWPGLYRWVQTHPQVHWALACAYASGGWQLIGIPFILGCWGRHGELPEFFFLLALSIIYVLIFSTPIAASSAFVHFNVADPGALASVSDFASLRDGSMKTFDLMRMQGLVSLPSFHTALSVLFVYSLRRMRFLFWPAAVLNLALIASTPTQGGHYLVDVIAGVAVAGLTVVSVNRSARRIDFAGSNAWRVSGGE